MRFSLLIEPVWDNLQGPDLTYYKNIILSERTAHQSHQARDIDPVLG